MTKSQAVYLKLRGLQKVELVWDHNAWVNSWTPYLTISSIKPSQQSYQYQRATGNQTLHQRQKKKNQCALRIRVYKQGMVISHYSQHNHYS